jgi:hypothetical protein
VTRRIVLAALAGALAVGPMVEPALAEKQKAKMTARIEAEEGVPLRDDRQLEVVAVDAVAMRQQIGGLAA